MWALDKHFALQAGQYLFILTISSNHLVADKADVAKQLVVVVLAVGQALLLVMARAKEGLLTLGAHKVLHTHTQHTHM